MNCGASANYTGSSLYVGDLQPDISESLLFEKFAAVGPVLSIRVCRDIVTRRSLGYAYVNFQHDRDAKKALETLNFSLLKGRPMRIMLSQRDPSLRNSGIGNIFIKNLDKRIDNKALYNIFSKFGGILSSKVVQDESGRSKGFGFVHFEGEEFANRAIENMNGILLNSKKVFVGNFIPRQERERKSVSRIRSYTSVYVKNLEPDISDEQLRDIFSMFGEITSCKIIRQENGNSKCFGFVSFKFSECAVKAVEDLNGKEMVKGGKLLYVELTDNISELKDTSSKVIMKNDHGKGFGFVCFSTQEETNKAVANMNGRTLGCKPLDVAVAQCKEDREAYLTTQYIQCRPIKNLQMQQIRPIFPSGTNRPNFFRPSIPQPQGFYGPMQVNAPAARIRPASCWVTPPAMRPALANPQQQPLRAMQQITPRNCLAARPITGQQKGSVLACIVKNQFTLPAQKVLPQQTLHEEPLTASLVTPVIYDTGTEKQIFGERLYPVVHDMYPELADKITGMLLEMDNSEVLNMLEHPDVLTVKVEETVSIWKARQAKQAVEKK